MFHINNCSFREIKHSVNTKKHEKNYSSQFIVILYRKNQSKTNTGKHLHKYDCVINNILFYMSSLNEIYSFIYFKLYTLFFVKNGIACFNQHHS